MLHNDQVKLPSCSICSSVAEKFVEGYKRTSQSNFGGGNTDWEERKLKEYGKSETRLIEIVEKICKISDTQCTSFIEKNEEEIEEWWKSGSSESIDDFYRWLCIDRLQLCCPKGTFGKNCRQCQRGDNGQVCSGDGECDGDGTRTGNGRCLCGDQFSGTNCSNCRSGYEKSIDENKQVICSDVDECQSNLFLSPCLLYKCNNTIGSYECYGEPFYRDTPKISTLVVLLITSCILSYKDMYYLASISLLSTSVLIVLFAKNIF